MTRLAEDGRLLERCGRPTNGGVRRIVQATYLNTESGREKQRVGHLLVCLSSGTFDVLRKGH